MTIENEDYQPISTHTRLTNWYEVGRELMEISGAINYIGRAIEYIANDKLSISGDYQEIGSLSFGSSSLDFADGLGKISDSLNSLGKLTQNIKDSGAIDFVKHVVKTHEHVDELMKNLQQVKQRTDQIDWQDIEDLSKETVISIDENSNCSTMLQQILEHLQTPQLHDAWSGWS